MKVCAHVLVKNEAKFLWFSVSSIAPYVDSVILWDTGSTDGSLEIVKKLIERFPDKILFKKRIQSTAEDFTNVRQEMLNETSTDWILMVDADEIWWKDSIKKVIGLINKEGQNLESIVVPTINPVGDIFHKQEDIAGRYKLAGKTGHYNLRGVNTNIPGLRSFGRHGVWGWVDGDDKMIQDRDQKKIAFIEAPYLHMTYLERAGDGKDVNVIKRKKKLKHEIGIQFPKDYYYPEVLFQPRPLIVDSPWKVMTPKFKFISFFETPLRKLKRRLWWGKAGY